ncbi:hypothetical protein C2E21_6991 [Chlorella sorokiniana]|uniref:Uncharacterized protein n=1 Tax=Chlorella sorokiniana TaxID=3076 RepID=A0A2P6TJB6_CHLSO|nr:hypothetical protein C2E21_6991 [Chlorella sorokiniana]|eukprot:PRW39345.1 hypothetical protein C2E21_6991 [Chlorella sorokiniana]
MEAELSVSLDSMSGYDAVGQDIYKDDPRASPLEKVEDDPPAAASFFLTTPLTVSAFTIKEEPHAPPSPLANATNPFIGRSFTPAANEAAIEAPAPLPPAPPPRSLASPPPKPAIAAPTPARRRRRSRGTAAATPVHTKAGRCATVAKKAAKGEEAALNEKKCALAWVVWQSTKGKDPRSGVKSKHKAGRKEKFNYYKHFSPALLYACATYPDTFKLWVLREGYLRDNASAIAEGRIPCKATCSRAVNTFKKASAGNG